LDSATGSEVLHKLAEQLGPDGAPFMEDVRAQINPFSSILHRSDAEMHAITKVSDTDVLAKALIGADEAIKNTFIRNMTVDRLDILRERQELYKPISVYSILEAQRRIAMEIRGLEDAETIRRL
jgi:flagellar motor switch protein FliG